MILVLYLYFDRICRTGNVSLNIRCHFKEITIPQIHCRHSFTWIYLAAIGVTCVTPSTSCALSHSGTMPEASAS